MNPTLEERARLVRSVEPFIRQQAFRIVARVLGQGHYEDGLQLGREQAWRASKTWDPAKGKKTFLGYCGIAIASRMCEYTSRIRKKNSRLMFIPFLNERNDLAEMNASGHVQDDFTVTRHLPQAREEDPAATADANDLRGYLRRVLSRQGRRKLGTRKGHIEPLGPKMKAIALLYGLKDGKERTVREVGKLMGLSRERVYQYERRALAILAEVIPQDSVF